MPCRYTTFDGRLLWFDGVEGKRELTLTVLLFVCFLFFCFVVVVFCFVFGWVGGEGDQTVSLYSAYWCLWHTMRLTSFRHYYFPQVLSMVT